MHEGHHGILDGVKKAAAKKGHTHPHDHKHDHDHPHDHSHDHSASTTHSHASDQQAWMKWVAAGVVGLLIIAFFFLKSPK